MEEEIFFTNSSSFDILQVSSSAIFSGSSNVVTIIGSGSSIFVISGSAGPIFEIDDYEGNSSHIFAISSGSINILAVSQSQLVTISGSLRVTDHITGSLYGTASWAQNAITAAYIDAANVVGLSLFQIVTGSVTASVGVGPNDLFLIKSGSTTYFNISSSGNTTINTNKFVVQNLTTQQPVLTVSQSIVQFATQSADPIGNADIGGIIFTSTAMYIGLN
jgi:hypothetical protein